MASAANSQLAAVLPPPAPPLPPAIKEPSEKVSIALKVRDAPPGWASEARTTSQILNFMTPPAGFYFFYGSLQDPDVLVDILELQSPPVLRSAHLIGYKLRMWGQYPALQPEPDVIVQGHAFEVTDEASAAKLATYETNSYRATPCFIHVGGAKLEGYVFLFCGNGADLTDGTFDLVLWRRLNGRYGRT